MCSSDLPAFRLIVGTDSELTLNIPSSTNLLYLYRSEAGEPITTDEEANTQITWGTVTGNSQRSLMHRVAGIFTPPLLKEPPAPPVEEEAPLAISDSAEPVNATTVDPELAVATEGEAEGEGETAGDTAGEGPRRSEGRSGRRGRTRGSGGRRWRR